MEMTQGRLYLSTTCLTQDTNNYIYSGALVCRISQYISFSAEIGIPTTQNPGLFFILQ
jgi:hypothetical protein